MNCRHCNQKLKDVFIDLSFSPPSNAYLNHDDLSKPESYYPLKIMVCEKCFLVQTIDFFKADHLFQKDYAYFSSSSKSWLNHAKTFSDSVVKQLSLGRNSLVIEIASNDGYLLKNFVDKSIPCIGVEPTKSTGKVAENLGIKVIYEFFSSNLAQKLSVENKIADLIICNNVFAHVPDINDFTAGLKTILKKNGTVTIEFPDLLNLINKNAFDTIYHEHFSYLSLHAVESIFNKGGLKVYDIKRLNTHGGSLRIFGCHSDANFSICKSVFDYKSLEKDSGLLDISTFSYFQESSEKIKFNFLDFLLEQKRKQKKVVGYGAAAKGNTLLNFCGIRNDLIPYVVDISVHKQNKFLPGSHILIVDMQVLKDDKPDYVIIFPWNLKDEIIPDLNFIRSWGGKFVIPLPQLSIIP